MMHTGHYAFVQTHGMYNTKSEPKVNCGLWVIITCLGGFFDCDKCTTQLGDADNKRGCAHVGVGGTQKICTFL